MKPLPAQNSSLAKSGDLAMPSIPNGLGGPPGHYSTANRRVVACPVQRVYPWLLFTSTAVAAVFCVMYVTKPVVLAASGDFESSAPSRMVAPPAVAKPVEQTANVSSMPDGHRLPGEKPVTTKPAAATPSAMSAHSPATDEFEQTNLRIQHILTADTPDGHVAKLDIDVPVLYQSRNFRWTPAEVAEARRLLVALADYQDKSKALRAEGGVLLESWNHLVKESIPSGQVRADSPSLPSNQQDGADVPRPAGLDTAESIRIQPAEK